MKKKCSALLALLLAACLLLSGCTDPHESGKDARLKVVTSFYPVYTAALNLVDGVPGVDLQNLTQPTTGCLHDYQLTPEDMIAMEGADVLVVNGAGMESFLTKVLESYPSVGLITASDGIALIEEEHDHSHEGHDHAAEAHSHEEEGNPHVWVSISNYMQYVQNIADGLSNADPDHRAVYQINAQKYLAKLTELKTKMHGALDSLPNRGIVTFHEAFGYFAEEFDLQVEAVIEREPGTDPTVQELIETVDKIEESGCRALFAEPQYEARLAETISAETGAKVYTLDPCVSGEYDKDAYLKAMEENLKQLVEALSE